MRLHRPSCCDEQQGFVKLPALRGSLVGAARRPASLRRLAHDQWCARPMRGASQDAQPTRGASQDAQPMRRVPVEVAQPMRRAPDQWCAHPMRWKPDQWCAQPMRRAPVEGAQPMRRAPDP